MLPYLPLINELSLANLSLLFPHQAEFGKRFLFTFLKYCIRAFIIPNLPKARNKIIFDPET